LAGPQTFTAIFCLVPGGQAGAERPGEAVGAAGALVPTGISRPIATASNTLILRLGKRSRHGENDVLVTFDAIC
jgi:hypothetical protein